MAIALVCVPDVMGGLVVCVFLCWNKLILGNSYVRSRTSLSTLTYEAERTLDLPRRQTTESPGHKPLVVDVVVVGLFEEEEEGISVTSDVASEKYTCKIVICNFQKLL